MNKSNHISNSRLRQWVAGIDGGYVVVLLISLIALWPFISRVSLPQQTDAELHIFRLAELSYLVRHGEIYPRWSPNFFHGYGYPIFNYYAPLSYYIGLIFDLLPVFDAVAAVKIVFELSILLAAFGTYGFVRDNWGRPAGYVATAVYLYAPYVQYIDPHARGVLAETLSLGLFPLALWSMDRLWRQRTFWRVVTAVFAIAAVILSHNLLGLFYFGVLVAWAGWRWLISRLSHPANTSPARHGPLLFAVLGLGLMLASFFWLPVLWERHAVNLNTLIGYENNYDFHTHFLHVRDLLAASSRLDWGATQPALRFNLGLIQWLLGSLGLILLIMRRTRHSMHLAFFALAAGVTLFLMLPISTFLWEATPILPFFQFPWRLLGVADFMLAVLAGAGTAVFVTNAASNRSALITAGFTLLPLLAGLPRSQPAPWPDFAPTSLARVAEIEFKGRWVGTTSTADYIPTTVDTPPKPNDQMMADFYAGRPIDRVNRVTLPAGASVIGEELRPTHFRYTVSSPESFRLRLFLFDFPGWQVRVDGIPVETELGRPEGFIVIPVSAGEHVVDVKFGSTPPRTAGWLLSGLALLATLMLAWRQRSKTEPLPPVDFRFSRTDWGTLAAVGVFTAVFALLLNPSGRLHYNSTGFEVEPAETAVFADFGTQIALIAYDAPVRQAEPGGTVPLTLYWKALQLQDINYQVFVHLLAADGTLVTQSDKLNPGDFPTRRWPLDKYVRDAHFLSLPPDLPPGTYAVSVGLWNAGEGWRLPLLDAHEDQLGDHFVLFDLTVEEP